MSKVRAKWSGIVECETEFEVAKSKLTEKALKKARKSICRDLYKTIEKALLRDVGEGCKVIQASASVEGIEDEQ